MFEPENELGVIVLFAQQCEEAGFEILSIQSAFPDALVRRGDVEYRVEFEFLSSNFYVHGHDPREADLVICWQCKGDCVLPVLVLSEQGWQQKEIILPPQIERELDYWKHRALKAERRIWKVKEDKQQAVQQAIQKRDKIESPVFTPRQLAQIEHVVNVYTENEAAALRDLWAGDLISSDTTASRARKRAIAGGYLVETVAGFSPNGKEAESL